MAFELNLVTTYIAGLTITGRLPDDTPVDVTIHNYDTLETKVNSAGRPVLQPDIATLVTTERHEFSSFGSGATAKQVLVYTVPYILYYAPVGSERSMLSIKIPNLIYTLTQVATVIVANTKPPNPVALMQLASVSFGQTVSDAVGFQHHGGALALRIVEFIN